MSKEIHGHKVLNILAESPMSRSELKEQLDRTYGNTIQFHTCKTQGLTFDQLFEFFVAKEKIVESGGKFRTNTDKKCG